MADRQWRERQPSGRLPPPHPRLGGQDLAVSSSSPNKAAALRVIKYLTGADAERCLFAVGGFPATRADAYRWPTPASGLCGQRPGASVAIADTVLAALRTRGQPRPRTRYYTEFSDVLQNGLTAQLDDARRSGGAVDEQKLGDLVDQLADAARGRAHSG